ncbi:MAG TPA: hypothetical protein IAC96_08175 [Candidatus Fimimorpha faecalis]|uniref:Uncharacterized protein n=1 Tax=Candidatus Fimimorpha faecalis TaxID=2840824 RepID=A0A9D1EFE6_9FIRM|nr:hypothetical protein [Candidatus Fimimorpha faecalis]
MIVEGAIFALMGLVIGTIGTILFFRMDKGWKQILTCAGSALSAGGTGRIFIDYLGVSSEKKSAMILILVVGTIICSLISFLLLTKLLKGQTGNNVIRVLDIILAYDGFLKDYYEGRKKEVDQLVNSAEIKKREEKLKCREEDLNDKEKRLIEKEKNILELKSKIQECKEKAITVRLPEDCEIVLTESFINKIPLFVDNICKFSSDVENLTNDFYEKFKSQIGNIDKEAAQKLLKGYFVGIGLYIANDLFGVSNNNVRTHFRVLKDNTYIQCVVILGSEISKDQISNIPKGNSMIDKSFELKRSLVASLNPESKYDTNTVWEDFITIAEYNIVKDGAAFLSMGISIKYAEQFKEMLYFLNYYKIERCLVSYIDKINKVCDIIKTLE